MTAKHILILSAALLATLSTHAQRYDNYLPDNTGVSLTTSTLPIVRIDVGGGQIERQYDIPATMRISYDNGDVYSGAVKLKYHSSSLFLPAKKKSYDVTLSGSTQLLGMREGASWQLIAPSSDRSLLRTMLQRTLVRPYAGFVPDARYCEVVVDGVYRGIYLLSEVADAGRLGTSQIAETGRATSGSIWQSANHPVLSDGTACDYAVTTYRFKDDAAKTQMQPALEAMEADFAGGEADGYFDNADEQSFIDYLLSAELAHNTEAYRWETTLYANASSQVSLVPSDAELGFGNNSAFDGFDTEGWIYEQNDTLSPMYEPHLVPFYWQKMTTDVNFLSLVHKRWAEWRNGNYSDAVIAGAIDSLSQVLSQSGALAREAEAYPYWGGRLWPNYTVPASYDDEIGTLKSWIEKRLAWMDERLLGPVTVTTTEYVPVTVSGGFNADVIAEASPVASHTTDDLDGSGWVYATTGVVSSGLPSDGKITSASTNAVYQMADYAADNVLKLNNYNVSGTLTLVSPVSAEELYLLNVASNGDGTFKVAVNYSDGTSEDNDNLTAEDWFGNSGAITGLYRCSRNESGTMGGFRIGECSISVDSSRQVKSLTITNTSKGADWQQFINVFAVSAKIVTTTVVSGIENVSARDDVHEVARYNIAGQRLQQPVRGINIVRYSNGKTKKVMVR